MALKGALKSSLNGAFRSSVKRTSWLAVLLASMLAENPHPPENELAMDTTVWDFQQREDRRTARKVLNNRTPRCIFANRVEGNDYALELAKWQYRTGTGFLLTTNKKDE